MPQALKTLYLIQFGSWKISISSLLALWGNKNGLPSMKVKSCKIFRTNLAQQAANGPVWMPQALKTLCLIQFGSWKISLSSLLALWGNKNGLPQYEGKKAAKFQNKISSAGCKWSSLNAPSTLNPLSHPIWKLEDCSFFIIGPLG